MSDPAETDPGERPPEGTHAVDLLGSVQRLAEVGVWVHDIREESTWWSRDASRIHWFDAGEHPPLDAVVETYAEGDRAAVRDRLSAARRDGEAFVVDVTLPAEGTRTRSVRLGCEPRTRDGKVVTLHGIVQDVTDAKRREQRIEVLRRTSQRLKRAKSRGAVAEVLADASKNILGLVNTTVRLVDEHSDTLQTVVATEECVKRAGERPDYPVDDDSPAARVFRTGEPERYDDIATSDDDWDRGELISGIYVPIGEHGVLSAGDTVPGTFDDRDLEAAVLLGQVGAEALTRIGWAKRSRAV